MSDTIGKRLDANAGLGTGFDVVRLFLAISVVTYHTKIFDALPLRPRFELLFESIVPAFFALSGFLVTGSAMRQPLFSFLANRFFRIVPALAATVLGCMLVIGPLVTSLPLTAYFTAPDFGKYALNLLGQTHMTLPGVFTDLPDGSNVNLSLWTVGWEYLCYLAVAAMALFGTLRRPRVMLALLCGFMAIRLFMYMLLPGSVHTLSDQIGPPAAHPSMNSAHALVAGLIGEIFDDRVKGQAVSIALLLTSWEIRVVAFFMTGALTYVWRDRFVRSRAMAWACVSYLFCLSWFMPGQVATPVTTLLTLVPVNYVIAYVGTSRLPRLPFIGRGDYSYGMYLWAYPIQQLVAWSGLDSGASWRNGCITLPLTLLAGIASWRLIEEPMLRRRRFLISRFKLKVQTAPT